LPTRRRNLRQLQPPAQFCATEPPASVCLAFMRCPALPLQAGRRQPGTRLAVFKSKQISRWVMVGRSPPGPHRSAGGAANQPYAGLQTERPVYLWPAWWPLTPWSTADRPGGLERRGERPIDQLLLKQNNIQLLNTTRPAR
jgi:hypothetical protein